jgi:hypothetical protein
MSDKYLLLIVEPEWDESTVSKEEYAEAMKEHGAFSAAVAAAGAKILGGEALTGQRSGFSVTPAREGSAAIYTDGPLLETTEVISGYYIIETETPELARELAPLCPTGGRIDVRGIWDMEV